MAPNYGIFFKAPLSDKKKIANIKKILSDLEGIEWDIKNEDCKKLNKVIAKVRSTVYD